MLRELTAEQGGLCAYTGSAIDVRLGGSPAHEGHLKFRAHNEHLKPQSDCRRALLDDGRTPGVDLGADLDHRNIVAALLVEGGGGKVRQSDLFGASHRADRPLPVIPTDTDCADRFFYALDGGIGPAKDRDPEAQETISALNLGNGTLAGFRNQAIGVYLEAIQTPSDVARVVGMLTSPTGDQLPEYCFAIQQVVQRLFL